MRVAPQFSVFMVNKPGVLSQVLEHLAKEKVNIVALTMMDSVEHGVMRVVVTAPKKAREILDRLNMPYSESEVLCLNLDNKAGALADVVDKLARAHINISYAYCTAGQKGGKTTGVLKVADVKKAMKTLKSGGKKASKKEKTIRRSKASRGH